MILFFQQILGGIIMGFFDVFKNKKTHEQKMDLAYQCFKPDMVGMLFINGKEQANEVILKLSKILRIDLDGLNEREYYEILQIYAYLFVKIVVQEAGEESAIKGLQIIEGKNNFPISWLNKQGYCEYQLYLEHMKGIKKQGHYMNI